jgi:hypothetical protein
MAFVTDVPTQSALLPPRRTSSSALGLRFGLLGRAAALIFTSQIGVVLFSLWVTLVAVSPLTLLAVLVLPVTGWVRAYADANRRAAGRMLGEKIPRPYRPTAEDATWLGRVWTVLRDPASWRDAWWMLVHAVAGCFLSTLQVSLFLGGLLYLIYPFLYWVTPEAVFGRPFGLFELHSVAESFWVMPLGVVSFGLWYLTAVPLSRAVASLTRGLLR